MTTEQLTELLIDEIRDIYHAEKQLVVALPKMAKAAENPDLRAAISEHLTVTEGHVARLESAFALLNTPAHGVACKGMQGLIEEGSKAIEDEDKGPIRDLAMIGAAQRIEHYEIAAYGTAHTLAKQVGSTEVAKLLEATKNEEKATDRSLTKIAGEIYQSVDDGEMNGSLAKKAKAGATTK